MSNHFIDAQKLFKKLSLNIPHSFQTKTGELDRQVLHCRSASHLLLPPMYDIYFCEGHVTKFVRSVFNKLNQSHRMRMRGGRKHYCRKTFFLPPCKHHIFTEVTEKERGLKSCMLQDAC